MIKGIEGHGVQVTPVIDVPPRRPVRRAVDLWRLPVALAVLVVAALLAVATRDFVRAAQQGLLDTATVLPPALRDTLVGTVQAVAMVAPIAAVVVWVVRRRVDPALRVLSAAALGAVGAWSLTHLALVRGRPDAWPEVLKGRDGLVQAGWPSAVYLAACAAAVVAAGPWLGARPRRALWSLTAGCALLSVVAAAIVPLDAVAALAVGAAAGSAVLLLGGAPADRPTAQAVADALVASGIPVAALRELPADEQVPGEGTVYRAVVTAGSRLAVRVLAAEDHNRDLFHRLARRALLRHPADPAAQTPLGAAEHELLMLVFAARTGARVDEPVMAYPVAGGGALVATVERDARALSALRDEELTDQLLGGVWTSVARLQEHRLGHGALRPEHVFVEPRGESRLAAFALGRLNAPPEVLGGDIAELLATTAVRIGPRRATACALAGLGPELLATALPYLQPLALMGSARRAVARYDQARARAAREKAGRRTLRAGGRPNLLHDLAAEVSTASGAKAVPPAHLARFTWKSALGLVGAFLVLHLVLPQLANAPAAVHALRDANWWWVLAVLPITFLSQAFSTCLQQGTIPDRLPFGPTYQVQFASSFLNRITPSNVGGMALNLRYLQKTGIETGAATASVGLQSLAGAVAMVIPALMLLCHDSYVHGRWDEAESLAQEGLDLAAVHGYHFWERQIRALLASGAALRGGADLARTRSEETTTWAAPRGIEVTEAYARSARHVAAMGQGDYEEAHVQVGWIDPPGAPSHGIPSRWMVLDLAEAAVRTGRTDEARAHVTAARKAGIHRISPRIAMITTGAEAVAADEHEAGPLFEAALSLPQAARWPWEHARIQLAYGQWLRRTRDHHARQYLSAALETFDRIGAKAMAQRARNELRATGVATATGPAAPSAALTVQERQIAELAAVGLTNRQIGERLFLSHRTVGSHLHRLYPKLGITSRAALRAALEAMNSGDEYQGPEPAVPWK